MRKIVLILLLLPIGLQAQQKDSKWNYGLSIGLESSSAEPSAKYKLPESIPAFSYTARATAGYKIKENFEVRTGLGFAAKLISFEKTGVVFGSDIDPITGKTTTSTYGNDYTHNEVQIPLQFLYFPNPKFFISVGAELNFQLNTEELLYFEYGNGDKEESREELDNTSNQSITFGIGYKIPLKDKRDLRISGYYQSYLQDHPLEEMKISSIGLRFIYILKR